MKKVALSLALSLSLALAGCKYDVDLGLGPGIKGDGNVVTENRNNSTPFTAIEISRGLDLEVTQSADASITVIADKNLQDHISTAINNGVLTITSDVNIGNASSKKIVVKLPNITSLQASSAASITGTGTIKSQNLGLSTSSAGGIDLNVESDNLTLESSSGSSMRLKGKALKLDIDTSSGSVVNAESLLANDVICDASSGSSIEVQPLVSLNANASSGSHVSYRGAPKQVSKDASSGGSITQQ